MPDRRSSSALQDAISWLGRAAQRTIALVLLLWFAAQGGLLVAAALAAGSGAGRRCAAGLLVLAAAILPWFASPLPFPRAALAALSVMALFKTLQISTTPGPWPTGQRIWHGLMPFDVRRTRTVAPGLDWTLLASVMAYGALAVAAILVGIRGLGGLNSPSRFLAAMTCTAVFLYATFEVLAGLLRLAHRLVGIDVPPIQRAPVLSRSAREFWGERWNRTVSEWLGQFAFLPLARRRHSGLGLLAAFAVSAAIHAWTILVALDAQSALMAGSFFVVQGFVVLIEARMRPQTWPPPLARLWTFLVLVLPSPLFLCPISRLIGW